MAPLAPPFKTAAAPPLPCFSSPSTPSLVSSPWPAIKLSSLAMAAHHGRLQPRPFFFVGQPKWMRVIFLLLYPSSILSETNSNLWISQDFIFQTNSDFISNSNFNPPELLPHPYISLGAPPPRVTMPISPQNRTLAATRAPPPSSVPLITGISIPYLSCQIKPHASREKPKTYL
jgi:hypothetical protein